MQKVTFICLLSDKQRKQFLFMNWNIFLGKKNREEKKRLWRGVQSETIFITQRKSSVFKKMFSTEINEIRSSS